MLAALTQTPELALGTDDAKRLATALANVTRHYKLPVLSPQRMALATLLWTAGSIYLPKARAISARRAGGMHTHDAEPQNAENVTNGPWPVPPVRPWFGAAPPDQT